MIMQGNFVKDWLQSNETDCGGISIKPDIRLYPVCMKKLTHLIKLFSISKGGKIVISRDRVNVTEYLWNGEFEKILEIEHRIGPDHKLDASYCIAHIFL